MLLSVNLRKLNQWESFADPTARDQLHCTLSQSRTVVGVLVEIIVALMVQRCMTITIFQDFSSLLVFSDTKSIRCGVPQGSSFGPLLFIIYMNDIYNVFQLLLTILYADDTCVLQTGSDFNKLVTHSILPYSILSLNVQQTYYAIFHRARIKVPENPHTVIFNKITLSKTNCIKYPGVILYSKISWIQHIKNKISKAIIGIMYKARKILTQKSLVNL